MPLELAGGAAAAGARPALGPGAGGTTRAALGGVAAGLGAGGGLELVLLVLHAAGHGDDAGAGEFLDAEGAEELDAGLELLELNPVIVGERGAIAVDALAASA